jgi:hypothetical protein
MVRTDRSKKAPKRQMVTILKDGLNPVDVPLDAKLRHRIDRLAPLSGGRRIPRWMRIYDSQESGDRYTVVFTNAGRYDPQRRGGCLYLGMSGAPYHPQGVCQHGEHDTMIDRPTYGHLGRRIKFLDLPKPCQHAALNDYCALWNLPLSELLPSDGSVAATW